MAKDHKMTAVEVLEKYGAAEINGYDLCSNWGYTFILGGHKYDARFWANCYGACLDRWGIISCEGHKMAEGLREKIERELDESDG